MKKNRQRQTNTYTSQSLQLKRRIVGNRSRATFAGAIYFIATIALAVVAFLPLVAHDLAPVGVMEFWKTFKPANFKFDSVENASKAVNSCLYALMLLGVVINALRTFGKLSGLSKKNATRSEGFNRNVYAVEDLGNIFSGSLAVITVCYFLIALICGMEMVSMLTLIVIGAGVFVHLFVGVISTKIAYFDLEDKEVIEQKRLVGRFAPFFRNVLQLATVFGIMYFLILANFKSSFVTPLLQKSSVQDLLKDTKTLIVIAAQVLAVLCLFALIKHATATTEYNINGVNAPGMKNFRVFSFLVFLFAGAAVVCKMLLLKETKVDINLLIVAVIAFVMFIIELLMRKMPKFPEDKYVEGPVDDEISVNTVSQQYAHTTIEQPPVQEKKGKKNKKKKAEEDAQAQAQNNQAQTMFVQGQPYPVPQIQPYPYPVPQPYLQTIVQPQAQVQPQMPMNPYVNILPVVTVKSEEPKVIETVKIIEKEPEQEDDVIETVDGPKVEINCPTCGKKLRVNSGAQYHRCPVCDKVFQLRKEKKK